MRTRPSTTPTSRSPPSTCVYAPCELHTLGRTAAGRAAVARATAPLLDGITYDR
jgi:hypothetical protein